MQAVNNGTNTTTSANPMKLTTKSEEKSNVDLLSDLDITINHAPLVPEVRPLSAIQKKEEAITGDTTEDDKTEKNNEQDKSYKTEQVTTSTEDKSDHENLQIVWDTWYNDVQPKKDPLGEPAALQKFINDVEKYEKFVDSLLVKTLSGATNLDIKWKEVQDFEVSLNFVNIPLATLFYNQVKNIFLRIYINLFKFIKVSFSLLGTRKWKTIEYCSVSSFVRKSNN